jgi:hypothetical protein
MKTETRTHVTAPSEFVEARGDHLKVARALGASRLLSTAGSSAKERAAADDRSLQQVDIVNLEHESLAEGLASYITGAVVAADGGRTAV